MYPFTPLITDSSRSLVIIGTGLSHPDAPIVSDLEGQIETIAEQLGVALPLTRGETAFFYLAADAVLKHLVSEGRSDNESRLWLAEQLGTLDQDLFIPSKGNTRRHRALARLALEHRLRSIVSLNWDTLIEVALESLGLIEGSCPPRPWALTRYARAVNDTDLPQFAEENVFPVVKPHGCVRQLERASRIVKAGRPCPSLTFKLTKSDLTSLDNQTQIDNLVMTYVAECPLVAIGWRAAEDYLRTTIIRAATAVEKTKDQFSLIARSWYSSEGKPETYHDQIAAAYKTDSTYSFFAVETPTTPKLDCFLQWLQALHALGLLINSLADSESSDIQMMLRELQDLCKEDPILNGWTSGCQRGYVCAGGSE